MGNSSAFKQLVKNKKILFIILASVLVFAMAFIIIINMFGLKSEFVIEAGSKEFKIESIFKRGKVLKGYSLVTDLSKIDLNKVGTHVIEIDKNGKIIKKKLKIVDTSKPVVTFKDSFGYIDYEMNTEDFIEDIIEYSNYTVMVINQGNYNEFGEYDINLKVIDEFGNETIGKSKLFISPIKMEYDLEYGTSLKKEDVVYDVEKFGKYLDDSMLEEVNKGSIGKYTISLVYENKTYDSLINVVDTTAPVVEVNNVALYDGQVPLATDFVKSVFDVSNYEVKIISDIDYNNIGEQNVVIEAIDEFGNSVKKDVVLSINYDKDPPQFSGIGDVVLNKYSNFDFNNGVKAYDRKDGDISYSVDSSSVNLNAYGTYYATYSATDAAGNTASIKRKIIINHDATDTDNKVKSYMVNAGNDPKTILYYIRNTIPYSYDWGGDDPVWFGLTNYKGNCYVHALLYLSILQKNGYEAKLIWNYPKTHYWVIVNMGNGTWRHCDPTPTEWHWPVDCVNDTVRYANLQGNDWDRSLWPKAL